MVSQFCMELICVLGLMSVPSQCARVDITEMLVSSLESDDDTHTDMTEENLADLEAPADAIKRTRRCPFLGSIVCSRNNVRVLEGINDAGLFMRYLQFGDECATESTVVCKNDKPCSGGCSVCPCDIDQSMALSEPYMKTLFEEVGPWCSEKNSRALMIGLGGGELLQYLLHHCSGMQVDTVELNSDVVSFAWEYFGLKESEQKFPGRLSIQQADALSAVKAKAANASDAYDVVLVDCFSGGGEVPESCRSREFSEKVKHLLKPSSIMLQNIWHYSSMNENVHTEFEQTKSIYSEVFEGALDVVPVPMPPRIRWVDILKATKTESVLLETFQRTLVASSSLGDSQ